MFFCFSFISAQRNLTPDELNELSTIKLDAINGNKEVSGVAKLFVLNIGQNFKEDFYAVALVKKSQIKEAKIIALYFEKTENRKHNKPITFDFNNDATHVIQHPDSAIDLVAIPTGRLVSEYYDGDEMKEYVYLTEDLVSKYFEGIKEGDLEPFKESLRKMK